MAFVIGSIELLGLLSNQLGLTGQPWDFLGSIDINTAGRVIVGIFLVTWIGAVLYWKLRKLGTRYAPLATDRPTTTSDASEPI